MRSTHLLSPLLTLAMLLAAVGLRAQVTVPLAAPTAASAPAQPGLATRRTGPAHQPRQSAEPQHHHHRWLITAVIAAAAAIITGIIVAHRDHSQRCQGCVGNFP